LRAKLSRLQQTPGPVGRRYSDLFGASDLAGFKTSSEFFNIFAAGLSDPRLVQQMTMYGAAGVMAEIGTGNGSAVVPSEMVRTWLDASLENEICRSRCRVIPQTTETLKIAGIDVSDNSGSAPGGFKASWSPENDEAIPQMGKFIAVEFHAKKLKLYAEASAELSSDGVGFDEQVGDAMIRSIGWGLDDSLLVSGTGAGQPRSILNDVALVTVAKEPAQAARTILYENIISMFSRLHPASASKAVWVCSSTAIPQLLSMVLGIGSAGVFLPATKEADGRFTLLGLPLLFTEKVPVVGTKGDIMLIDFSQYCLTLHPTGGQRRCQPCPCGCCCVGTEVFRCFGSEEIVTVMVLLQFRFVDSLWCFLWGTVQADNG
jgi:HK97 family phage major capsid protein